MNIECEICKEVFDDRHEAYWVMNIADVEDPEYLYAHLVCMDAIGEEVVRTFRTWPARSVESLVLAVRKAMQE